MKIVVVISFLICLISQALGTDYCNPYLCYGSVRHVACDMELRFSARCSYSARLLEVDQSAQDVIVEIHNSVRQKWASGNGNARVNACRMATVRWDNELAKLAEFNVAQCEMKHDQCHNTWTYRNSGQNLFYVSQPGGSPLTTRDVFQMAFDDWMSEGRYVTADLLAAYPSYYNGPQISHFVVAQENNVAVGCAVSNYEMYSGYDKYFVACNYATTNFPGWPIYRECAEAASECTTGTNPDYPALCSIDEYFQ